MQLPQKYQDQLAALREAHRRSEITDAGFLARVQRVTAAAIRELAAQKRVR